MSIAAAAHAFEDKFIYPVRQRARLIGLPGGGAHKVMALNCWQTHNAWDFALPFGTPVLAVADGVIGARIGPVSLDPASDAGGLRCYLKTADNEFYYAHLSRFAPATRPGARVRQGQVIGFSGSANGVHHLHLGCRDLRAYERVAEG